MISQSILYLRKLRWKALITFSIILLFWQLIALFHEDVLTLIWNNFHWNSPVPEWRFLSSPLDLIVSLPPEVERGNLLADSIRTSVHTSIAFAFSLLFSLMISVILSVFPEMQDGFEPIMKAMSGIPPVTLLPIFTLALGLDSPSIIALGVFGATLSTSLILLDIFRSINVDLSKILGNLGYSPLGIWLWKFSSVSENLYLSSREGLRWSLILVVVAEMQIGDVARGIGYYINSARLNQSYELVYLGIIACGLVALFLQYSLIFGGKFSHFLVKKMLLRL